MTGMEKVRYDSVLKRYQVFCPNGQLDATFSFSPILFDGDRLPDLYINCFHSNWFTFGGQYKKSADGFELSLKGPEKFAFKGSLTVDASKFASKYLWKLKVHGETGLDMKTTFFMPRQPCISPKAMTVVDNDLETYHLWKIPTLFTKMMYSVRLKLAIKDLCTQKSAATINLEDSIRALPLKRLSIGADADYKVQLSAELYRRRKASMDEPKFKVGLLDKSSFDMTKGDEKQPELKVIEVKEMEKVSQLKQLWESRQKDGLIKGFISSTPTKDPERLHGNNEQQLVVVVDRNDPRTAAMGITNFPCTSQSFRERRTLKHIEVSYTRNNGSIFPVCSYRHSTITINWQGFAERETSCTEDVQLVEPDQTNVIGVVRCTQNRIEIEGPKQSCCEVNKHCDLDLVQVAPAQFTLEEVLPLLTLPIITSRGPIV